MDWIEFLMPILFYFSDIAESDEHQQEERESHGENRAGSLPNSEEDAGGQLQKVQAPIPQSPIPTE